MQIQISHRDANTNFSPWWKYKFLTVMQIQIQISHRDGHARWRSATGQGLQHSGKNQTEKESIFFFFEILSK